MKFRRCCLGLSFVAALAALFFSDVNAQEPRTAVIEFTRPTHYTDGAAIAATTEIRYHVYQGARGPAGEKVRVATITETSATITTGLQPGETCWQVSAEANGTESELSNEACKSFAWPATQPITITVR